MSRRTKIVATVGPTSWDEPVLRRLIQEGLDVVRINFSHAEHSKAAEIIAMVRRLAEAAGRNVAILQDLQGPRIRIGNLNSPLELIPGHQLILTTVAQPQPLIEPVDVGESLRQRLRKNLIERLEKQAISLNDATAVASFTQENFEQLLLLEPTTFGEAEKHALKEQMLSSLADDPGYLFLPPYEVPIDYADLPMDVKPGDTILIADGLMELKVISTTSKDIRCTIMNGGTLTSHKGINVPNVTLRVATITPKDIEDLKFGVAQGVDYVALSFVRQPEDILHLKQLMRDFAGDAPEITLPFAIAKIEKHEAIDNFDAILEVVDGVMVARGDLGVELPAEQIPVLQKRIILKCNLAGKTVITATQMLESMIQNPRPTRAEATDVANAILDGTDATMLSGETANGLYPVEAVRVMGRIAETTETEVLYTQPNRDESMKAFSITDAISQATCSIGREVNAVAIITPTTSSTTARMVSRCRPKLPIYAITHNENTFRRLALVWGVEALLTEEFNTTDEMSERAEQELIARGVVKDGDTVVITGGVPVGAPGHTNLIKVHIIGESKKFRAK